MDWRLRKVVITVASLNLAYFGVEFGVAIAIGSVSLFADSVDFLEDTSLNFLIAVGLGWTVIQAINQQDRPVILGITILAATFVVVANLVVDLLYAVVDPRVRLY